jgi:hypothetical protein
MTPMQWLACEDAMPELGERVLMCAQRNALDESERVVAIGNLVDRDGSFWWEEEGWVNCDGSASLLNDYAVTHWAYLPGLPPLRNLAQADGCPVVDGGHGG